MFDENGSYSQLPLTSTLDELSKKQRTRLDSSWASVFFLEFFCRLKEKPFAVLYADCPSRPNYPVNVLVGLEYLKAGNGWSDEEMYDAFCYDIQVRYALGLRQLGDGEFDLRTLYYFRERLSRYMQETGKNLLDQAFEQVTDEQITAYRIKTGRQRMDSTQVASNIRTMGRLQLLVEVLQRVHRMLTEEDKAHYSDLFAPYIQGHAGQYVYHLKGQDTSEHLQKIGELMQRLVTELQVSYAQDPVYQMFERVFGEHYRVEERVLKTKIGKELSASSMQSPDDLEATYREKSSKSYRGYVVNITETCDPDNPLQLITKVQVAPNHTEDADLLVEALPNLQERTELETLYTDGGYGSADADQALQDNQVEQIQTAIRGRVPSTEKLNLADFEIKQSQSGTPTQITCPGQQIMMVQRSNQKKGFVAHFEAEICQGCPFLSKCPAQRGKRDQRWHLRFTQEQARMSQRRRKSLVHEKEGRNLRAAIEATVCSLKRPFPASKLPVRGRFRVTCMMIGSALVSNIRRIKRYLKAILKPENEPMEPRRQRKSSQEQSTVSFLSSVKAIFGAWITLLTLRTVRFEY
ncbi:MAG: transposase [Planctomycetes bacterium]|nr:transposase [Planctomycetota bacterium]